MVAQETWIFGEQYALLVADRLDFLTALDTLLFDDARFKEVEATWDFWLVTTDMDARARKESNQENRPAGLVEDSDGVRIWLRTWAQLINESRARLQMFQQQLDYSSDGGSALALLRRKHSERIPSVVSGAASPAADEEVTVPTRASA